MAAPTPSGLQHGREAILDKVSLEHLDRRDFCL